MLSKNAKFQNVDTPTNSWAHEVRLALVTHFQSNNKIRITMWILLCYRNMVKYTFLQKKKEICYLHLGKYLTRLFRHEDHRHEFNKEIKSRFLLLYTRNVKISDIVVFIFSWTVVVKNCSSKGREKALLSISVQSNFFYFALTFYKWFLYTRYK